MIVVNDLQKNYQKKEAVKGISFSVGKGETYAILGHNGAGKSTVLNILSTRLSGYRGKVYMAGYELGKQDLEIKGCLGVVFQEGVLDDGLTAEENLYVRGKLYGMKKDVLLKRINLVAKLTGIADFCDKPYGKLSGGQKRRCDIARALLPMPKILLLDEPTTGLDPKMRRDIWNTIHLIKQHTEATLILTTHYMEEAGSADRIAIMQEGSIVAEGTPMDLKQWFSRDELWLFSYQKEELKKILQYKKIPFREKNQGLVVPINNTKSALPILDSCIGLVAEFEVLRGTMDDVYLSITEGGRKNV